MMTRLTTLALALAVASGSVALNAQTPPPPPPPQAKTQAMPYVAAAGMSDLYEINSSQIALQKTKNPAIRRFADMLIKEHKMTTAATMAAAKKAGMNPPPPTLDAGTTASINELQGASGADFDRIYLAQQVPAHQAALDLHRSYASGGDQAALRASAKKAIPMVQKHLTAAERMQRGGSHGM